MYRGSSGIRKVLLHFFFSASHGFPGSGYLFLKWLLVSRNYFCNRQLTFFVFSSKLVSELDGMKQAVVRKLHYVLTAWLQIRNQENSSGRQLRWNEDMKCHEV